jgi:hypothetical protein
MEEAPEGTTGKCNLRRVGTQVEKTQAGWAERTYLYWKGTAQWIILLEVPDAGNRMDTHTHTHTAERIYWGSAALEDLGSETPKRDGTHRQELVMDSSACAEH